MSDDAERQQIWVQTSPTIFGPYTLEIHVGDDVVRGLTRQEARAHGESIYRMCAVAYYEAAVMDWLAEHGVPMEGRVEVLQMVRARRPSVSEEDREAMQPFRLTPAYGAKSGKPYLLISVAGGKARQWAIGDAEKHARRVLMGATAAELDGDYFEVMKEIMDDEGKGRAIVAMLGRSLDELSGDMMGNDL